MTPDEKQIWLCDAFNRRLHVFDTTTNPHQQVASIEVREEPGWVTFSIDGRYAYPSTGDVIDVASRKILTGLTDEFGVPVHSEKMLEIDFVGKKAVLGGCQFGLGAVGAK